ncbi:oligosaccharide flippase family protein [Shewanella polaris]|uniref:Uncharacterized protein n=1 Tax=Shewanella polaris TaxID=2588449 RepID=A0A4Y5YD66_9GAMM|nr:oligosaccharide flippase family protein [Shewanella polaris]QDE30499.1 hypothetical protein FH971_05615 [Shewanella polaris]
MSKLLTNSFIYTVLAIFEKGLVFFMMPIYTAYLSPADFGSYSLVLAINAFLILLYTFSLENGLGKFYYDFKADEEKVRELFGTIFTTVLLISFIFTLLFYFFYNDLFNVFSNNDDLHHNLKIGLACIAFYPAYSILKRMYQVKQESKKFGFLSFLYTLLLIMMNLVCIILLNLKSEGLLFGLLFTNIVFFSYSIFNFYKSNGFYYNFEILKTVLKYSLPLFPHSVSNIVTTMCDRIFVGYFLTLTAVGLYSVASQISMIFSVLIGSFTMAYGPFFFEKMKGSATDKTEIIKIAHTVVPIFCLFGIGFSLFSKEIVMLMATDAYLEAYNYAMILIFVFVFQSVYIFTAGPLLINSTTRYAAISIFAALLNIFLNYILIPIYGIYGAAVATLIQKIIAVILYSYLGYKSTDKLEFNFRYLILLPVLSFVIVFTLSPLLNQQALYISISAKVLIILFCTVILLLTNSYIYIFSKKFYFNIRKKIK